MEGALLVAAFGRIDEAIRVFDGVLERNPNCTEAFKLRATVYALRKDFRQAAADCEEAIVRAPLEAECYLLRPFLWQGGKPDEALKTYERLITIDPANEKAFTQRGSLLARLGKRDAALADFQAHWI